jgi:hypothetical protein
MAILNPDSKVKGQKAKGRIEQVFGKTAYF